MFPLHPWGWLLTCDVQICWHCAVKFHVLLFSVFGNDYEGKGAVKGALEIVLTSEPREYYLMASEEVLSLRVCSWFRVGKRLFIMIMILLVPWYKHDLRSLLFLGNLGKFLFTLWFLCWEGGWIELNLFLCKENIMIPPPHHILLALAVYLK